VQIDSPEVLSTFGCERRPVVRLPFRLDAVCLEYRCDPGGPETTNRLAGFVAEDERLARFLLSVSVELKAISAPHGGVSSRSAPCASFGSWSSRLGARLVVASTRCHRIGVRASRPGACPCPKRR